MIHYSILSAINVLRELVAGWLVSGSMEMIKDFAMRLQNSTSILSS